MKTILFAVILIWFGGCSSHSPKETKSLEKGVEKEHLTSQMKKEHLRSRIFSLKSQINNLNAMKTSAKARLLHHQNSGAANIESGSFHIKSEISSYESQISMLRSRLSLLQSELASE